MTLACLYAIVYRQSERKRITMIIVNDIHDAATMQNVLASVIRRNARFGYTQDQLQDELMMIIDDLGSNINRIDNEMSENEEV